MKKVLLVVYDNGSRIHYFPIGLAYVAAVLRKNNYYVEIYNQDMHHYPDEHLTEYLDNNEFDFVGVSVIGGYYQYRKILGISNAINNSKKRPYYVIGGHGPASEPEYFMEKTKADATVIGEGEITTIELFDAFSNNKSLDKIKGIAFWKDGKIEVNERRPLIEDVDSIPFPAYDLFPMHYYRLLSNPNCSPTDFSFPILSSRGGTVKCNFGSSL